MESEDIKTFLKWFNQVHRGNVMPSTKERALERLKAGSNPTANMRTGSVMPLESFKIEFKAESVDVLVRVFSFNQNDAEKLVGQYMALYGNEITEKEPSDCIEVIKRSKY